MCDDLLDVCDYFLDVCDDLLDMYGNINLQDVYSNLLHNINQKK